MSEQPKRREFDLDGKKFTCKAWTVKDRREFLRMQKEFKALVATPDAQEAILDRMIAFIADQTGTPAAEIENWDAITTDLVLDRIVSSNTAPKAALMSLQE